MPVLREVASNRQGETRTTANHGIVARSIPREWHDTEPVLEVSLKHLPECFGPRVKHGLQQGQTDSLKPFLDTIKANMKTPRARRCWDEWHWGPTDQQPCEFGLYEQVPQQYSRGAWGELRAPCWCSCSPPCQWTCVPRWTMVIYPYLYCHTVANLYLAYGQGVWDSQTCRSWQFLHKLTSHAMRFRTPPTFWKTACHPLAARRLRVRAPFWGREMMKLASLRKLSARNTHKGTPCTQNPKDGEDCFGRAKACLKRIGGGEEASRFVLQVSHTLESLKPNMLFAQAVEKCPDGIGAAQSTLRLGWLGWLVATCGESLRPSYTWVSEKKKRREKKKEREQKRGREKGKEDRERHWGEPQRWLQVVCPGLAPRVVLSGQGVANLWGFEVDEWRRATVMKGKQQTSGFETKEGLIAPK